MLLAMVLKGIKEGEGTGGVIENKDGYSRYLELV